MFKAPRSGLVRHSRALGSAHYQYVKTAMLGDRTAFSHRWRPELRRRQINCTIVRIKCAGARAKLGSDRPDFSHAAWAIERQNFKHAVSTARHECQAPLLIKDDCVRSAADIYKREQPPPTRVDDGRLAIGAGAYEPPGAGVIG